MNPLLGDFVNLAVCARRNDNHHHCALDFAQFVDDPNSARKQFYFEKTCKRSGKRVSVAAGVCRTRILRNVFNF